MSLGMQVNNFSAKWDPRRQTKKRIPIAPSAILALIDLGFESYCNYYVTTLFYLSALWPKGKTWPWIRASIHYVAMLITCRSFSYFDDDDDFWHL